MDFEAVDPEEIRKGDTIGKHSAPDNRMRVDLIDAPQEYGVTGKIIRQWTFTELGEGNLPVEVTTFREGQHARRYRT